MVERMTMSDGRTCYRAMIGGVARTVRTAEPLSEAEVHARLGLPAPLPREPVWPPADDLLYSLDPEFGQKRLEVQLVAEGDAMLVEQRRLAEITAALGPDRLPLEITYCYRRMARGGGEMGPYLRHLGSSRERERISIWVADPLGGIDTWLWRQGLLVNKWDPKRPLPGAPDVVRSMLYTRAETVRVGDETAWVAEKVNVTPYQVEPWMEQRLDAVAALSPAAREMLSGTPWADCPVIPYGVPPNAPTRGERAAIRRELGIPGRARVATWCGRMQDTNKGLPVLKGLIETFGDQIHWLVIGYFQTHPELRDQWARWIEGRPVTWVEGAFANEARRLMRAGDVHVSTSPFEGLGLVNIDALAAGIPVIASDSGGVRHAVISGATGFLAPHGDAAGLARALRHWLELSKAERARLGSNAATLAAARFDLRRYADACFAVDAAALLAREAKAAEPAPAVATSVAEAPEAEPCVPPAPPERAFQLAGARIAWHFDRPVTGGLLWRAAVLGAVLRRARVETSLSFARRRPHPILDWAREHGVTVTSTPEPGEVDLVHVGWPPLWPEWADGLPTCTWVAGRSVRPLLERPTAQRFDRLVLVHESMAEHVPADLTERCQVIHNTVPPDWYGGRKKRRPTILCVGRWDDPVKRLVDVSAAVAALPEARFVVAGPLPRSHVPAHFKQALSTGRVRWLPSVTPMQMPALFRQALIYWQPSADEGFPVAALEAAASGCALVLSDTGGSREVVADNGVLVSGLEAAVMALEALLSEPTQTAARGARGPALLAERLPWGRYIRAYVQLYLDLLGRTG